MQVSDKKLAGSLYLLRREPEYKNQPERSAGQSILGAWCSSLITPGRARHDFHRLPYLVPPEPDRAPALWLPPCGCRWSQQT